MAVRLRLKRTGKKKQPSYRVVAVDSRKPRDGRVLEIIGTYDPRQEPSAISIANERAVHWLSHGAQPSDTVSKLLTISGAWDEFRSQGSSEPADSSPEAVQAASSEPAPAAAPTPDLVLDTPEPGADDSPETSAEVPADEPALLDGAPEPKSPEPGEAQ
ncbi:30S ribosomal protein S16 [Candidatus Poriferisodalis sp.]|uniref:30S ribosomal protein S16 n=1 Tax=Candidatus Poriferisodalis sp. TaxID=3101277 RepID=UPI003B5CD43A